MGVRPHGWRSQGWRQDAADKRSEGSRKGKPNYLWIPRRSGHIYKGPSPSGDTLSHNTLLHLTPHDDTRIYIVSRDTGSVLSVNVLSRVVRSLFELLKQNIRCTQQTIFEYSCNNFINIINLRSIYC